MPVYFHTPGLIDLDTIRLQGVSVKINENPIGYFGTGLKFAIATLLRAGCIVRLHRYKSGVVTTLEFTARIVAIRGQPFARVYMGDEGLSFTTDLGKNWEIWQAYRELYSNTLDEGGIATTSLTELTNDEETIFEIGGEAFLAAHEQRGDIFLEGKPLWECSAFQIFNKPSANIFYRGVRAGSLPGVSQYTYNMLVAMELTEDRTIKDAYLVYTALGRLLPTCDHPTVANYLTSEAEAWDQKLDYDWPELTSPVMEEAIEKTKHNHHTNRSLLARLDRFREKPPEHSRYHLIEPTPRQQVQIDQAFTILGNLACSLEPATIKYVESIGHDVLGIYSRDNNQIYISRRSLDMGAVMLAGTLYEEWLHQHERLEDCSRGLQDYLLQRLIAAYA